MIRQSAAQMLLEITPNVTDRSVAVLIAGAMLETDRQPYIFSIDHNVGPPDYKACPLDYTWKKGKIVGIHTMNRLQAEAWIAKAILLKYTVGRCDKNHKHDGSSMSLDRARSRALRHQTPLDDSDVLF